MKRYKLHAVAALLIGVALQACKVTKDYVRPELGLPVSFEETTSLLIDSNIREVPNYTAFFQNEELITILDSIMANNFDLLIASENILSAQAALKSIKLNYLPDLNLQINAGLQRLSHNSMMGSFSGGNLLFEDYNIGPSLSWEIDFWGKLRRQREEALATYFTQGEAKRSLRVQLVAQAAQTYYNLLSLDEQLKITKEVEHAMAETLALLEVQYSVGEVNTLAVKQSEAQLAETRALIPEILAAIQAQENALKTLTGSFPARINRSTSLSDPAFAKELSTGVPVHLLANRPDVKQQELALQAASARVGIAKANFYPALKITGQGGLNSVKASDWFSIPASLFGNATAGLTQPIFNRRSIRSAYEQAVHQREAAVLQFRKSVVTAVEEVSTVLVSIEQLAQQRIEVDKRALAMRNAIADAQVLYNFGEANYLEVLTVQQVYFQTKMAKQAILSKEINAYIALYRSLGGS